MTENISPYPCEHCGNKYDSMYNLMTALRERIAVLEREKETLSKFAFKSPWVSVEDGLPEMGLPVYVRLKDAGRYNKCEAKMVKRDSHHSECWELKSFSSDATYIFGIHEVTHWMPIPPLPETK